MPGLRNCYAHDLQVVSSQGVSAPEFNPGYQTIFKRKLAYNAFFFEELSSSLVLSLYFNRLIPLCLFKIVVHIRLFDTYKMNSQLS